MLSPWTEPLDEVVDDVLEYGHVELVSNPLTVAFGENEIGLTQNREVA
jgi:hypothetical protein